MAQEVKDRNQTTSPKEESENSFKGLAIGLIIFEIGAMVAYGLIGTYYEDPTPPDEITTRMQFAKLFMMGIFAIIGFGLLLSSYGRGTWLGMGTTFIVTAMSIQLCPILQSFWFSVFNTGFSNTPTDADVGASVAGFWKYYFDSELNPSTFTMGFSLLSIIAILCVMTSVMGRISIAQVVQLTTWFLMGWTLNYNLIIYLMVQVRDFNPSAFSPYYFDVYGSTFMYLFAGFFSLAYTCILDTKFPNDSHANNFNHFSMLLSLTGSAFIFATFIFTSNNIVNYSAYGENISIFAVLFSLAGSVIGTYLGSLIVGSGRVGYKECVVGTISGAIAIGAAAPLIYNIGFMILIGAIAGFIAGIYMGAIFPKINQTYVKDSMGMFGPIMFIALLASFLLLPVYLVYYKNTGKRIPGLGQEVLVPDDFIGWQLTYVGLSAGIGLGFGLIAVLLSKCSKNSIGIGKNLRYFSRDTGLYTSVRSTKYEVMGETENRLKKEDAL